MNLTNKEDALKRDALHFHEFPKPGKISIVPLKPLTGVRELSLAYSPGVAFPCLAIQEDQQAAYKYTSKGNMVAVISNGTAVLGLGDIGYLAGKPVMEGKAVLFKTFAGIDSVDIEVNEKNIDKFVEIVAAIGETWGGINLEDIKSPECFEIEAKLKKRLSIPVFHDDQHGTAIITAAGLINACDITGRKLENIKIVMNGAGAAGIACLNLIKRMGVKSTNIILCDRSGPITRGRNDISQDDIKAQYISDTKARTLAEALDGADVFIGLSAKDALSKDMILKMTDSPIIFAMANPDPEIRPEDALSVRPDAIVATGRSDYPNQVNNVMGFPYIFRGALDVEATNINEEMKVAAALAIAKLARMPIPTEVIRRYPDRKLEYGKGYIIPTPFDPRLIVEVSSAVAKAAIDTGVARKKITDWEAYKETLRSHTNPAVSTMSIIVKKVRQESKTVVFAEGEEVEIIKAAVFLKQNGIANPILVGNVDKIKGVVLSSGMSNADIAGIEIVNSAIDKNTESYVNLLFTRLQRKGYLLRDCERMVKLDRNIFSACLLSAGGADAMVTGYTRGYNVALNDVTTVLQKNHDDVMFGVSVLISQNKTIFVADTAINEFPTPEEMVRMTEQIAEKVIAFGIKPIVAFISHSTFGEKDGPGTKRIKDALKILDAKKVSFVYDGEMNITTALSDNPRKFYPFNKLPEPANILIMPGLHSATIATNLLKELSGINAGVHVIGPILMGLEKSVQILSNDSDLDSIIDMATIACAYS